MPVPSNKQENSVAVVHHHSSPVLHRISNLLYVHVHAMPRRVTTILVNNKRGWLLVSFVDHQPREVNPHQLHLILQTIMLTGGNLSPRRCRRTFQSLVNTRQRNLILAYQMLWPLLFRRLMPDFPFSFVRMLLICDYF